MSKTTRFLKIISDLPAPELDLFWYFVAEQIKQINGNDSLRTALSEADAELKAGGDRPRLIMRGVRKLSGDQLHRVILAHRERLIPFVEKCYNWKAMIVSWILFTRRDHLIKVLDALGCPHNGKGSRRGNPPKLTLEQATERMMALSSDISFDDLAVIIAGLISNHDDWDYLESTLEWLQGEAQHAREMVQTTAQCQKSTTMTATQFSTDPATRVKTLRGQMDALIADLQGLITKLQAGRLPDLTMIASTVEQVQTEFATLVTELRPTDESLEGLTAALHARAELTTALAMLDRLERLRHRQNPEFVGIVQIRQRCAEMRQMVIEVTSLDEAITKALTPLHALENLINDQSLVNDHRGLDEAAIEKLAEVCNHFGAQTARAVIQGDLEFGAAPEPPGVTPEPPGVTPEPPGATPEPPGVTPEPPGAAPEPPGAAPEPPGAAPEPPVATLLKADLASIRREDWVRLGEIQRSWLERRQPLRAWLLASEVERRLISHQIHIEDLPLLPSWACRLLLVTSDAKLPLSDEDKELLFRIRNLSGDRKELMALWITAELLENATDKPLRIMRLVSPQQFNLPPHSLGGACVEQLLTPVFNGGSLRPPKKDPADFEREFDQAIQNAQEILNPSRNNYKNGWVKIFWRDLIASTGRMGQILADAKERRFPARTLSVELIVEDLPEWPKILSEYRNNMHNRMEEFANRIETARSAHKATQGALQADQSAISKQAIAEILRGIQHQTGNAWWLEVIKSGITHL